MNIFIILLIFPVLIFAKPLKVNILSWFNGKGLETDVKVLKKALKDLGYEADGYDWHDPNIPKADINIFIENIVTEQFHKAKYNWFIPNPEWYTMRLNSLKGIDLVLCRTRQSVSIFQELGYPTYYLGFTSPDCYRPDVEKNYHLPVHLPGSSDQKGSESLMKIWDHFPGLPPLFVVYSIFPLTSHSKQVTLIKDHIELEEFRKIQNSYGIHLCTSEAEGFGHYIMEAMSTGAVVMTSDGPPMNELIKDSRCLIPCYKTKKMRLGRQYMINPNQFFAKFKQLLALDEETLKEIGDSNRARYLKRTKEFHDNLAKLMEKTGKN